MGCAAKKSKATSIALGSLQRLKVTRRAVPQSAMQDKINTMEDCMRFEGVDIQLRILQTLLSLITNFTFIHGSLLGDVRFRRFLFNSHLN